MKTKLDLKRIRELIRKYPAASAAVVGGLALLFGWQIYQMMGTRPAAPPAAVAPPAARSPAPNKPPAPGAPGAPGAAAPGPGAPGPGAAGGPGYPPVPPGPATGVVQPAGRADPFAPLVSTGPGAGRAALPPVPILGPGGIPLPGGPFPPGGPGGEGGLRLAGIIWNRGAIAIMVDERGSYVVSPGDEISPGQRLVRIDAGRRVVQVQRSGGLEELTLQGRGGGAGQ